MRKHKYVQRLLCGKAKGKEDLALNYVTLNSIPIKLNPKQQYGSFGNRRLLTRRGRCYGCLRTTLLSLGLTLLGLMHL